MNPSGEHETWDSGPAYERYVGRWSRQVARVFLTWLAVPAGARWLDVGCGTGALGAAILADQSPLLVRGIDRSEEHVAHARRQIRDARASFGVGDAQDLPVASAAFDVAVSGLVLNFVPAPLRMVSEMRRAVRPGGTVAVYVWDYAGKAEFLRYFWDAAVALDPPALALDEGIRFPICRPEPLAALFEQARLSGIETRALDIPTEFAGFDDYWLPFLGGQGPAPGHVMSLSEEGRGALRERLRSVLPVQPDGSISLVARAWAVGGHV